MKSVHDILRVYIPRNLYSFCCRRYYDIQTFLCEIKWKLKGNPQSLNPVDIPIIINNYNRLSMLVCLINSLTSKGYNNIHIIDNNSTYQPLLDYYSKCEYEVFRLDKNYGFQALWQSGIFEKFKDSYYVYTDADMEILPECPKDFMSHFIAILEKYPRCTKVGFGIKIDDLPDYFPLKEKVLAHESIFWQHPIEENIYYAIIDTTFALYRPYTFGASSPYKVMFRTGYPYMVRHLPWYLNWENMSDEELYYLKNISESTHWSRAINKTYSRT